MKKLSAILLTLCVLISACAFAESYRIRLSETSITLSRGDSYKVSYSIEPVNLSTHTVTFTSANAYVASVDKTGRITANAAGSTTITARMETGASANVTVRVPGNAVKLLNITNDDIELEKGGTVQLEYEINSDADDKRVIWMSDDTSVATVDSKGLVKAVDGGTAVITLMAVNGMIDTARVYVPSEVKTLQLYPTELFIEKGAQAEIDAYVFPGNARNREVSFESSAPSIASVDENGVVTAHKDGSCTVTASTANGVHATVSVAVGQQTQQVLLSAYDTVLSLENAQTVLTAELTPAGTDKKISWKSSNESVVTVKDGKLTAKSYGTAVITASAVNGASAQCTVHVCEAPEKVSFMQQELYVVTGTQGIKPQVIFTPAETYEAGAVFASEDESILALAGDGTLIPVMPGSTVLNVEYPSGLHASVRVNVYDETKGLYLPQSSYTIGTGRLMQLKVYAQNGKEYFGKVTGASDNPQVCTYYSGYILARSAGSAIITVTTDGNVKCSCVVNVTDEANAAKYSVALTFDNGPGNYTREILNVLDSFGVRATFFMLGTSIERHTDYAAMFAGTQHELGNHTYSNVSMNPEDSASIAEQLERTDKLIKGYTGREATLLRAADARLSASLFGTFLIDRTFVGRGITADAAVSAEEIVAYTLNEVFDTAVLTFHESNAATAAALEKIIPQLMLRGYRFVTVSELIGITGSTQAVFATSK